MQAKIIATLTQTRDRTPLASVGNLPGNDADLTPTQLRSLARVLNEIADECEAMPMKAKHFTPRRREYSLIVMDETHYLLSNPANAAHIAKSIAQDKAGQKEVKQLLPSEFRSNCNT